MKRKDTFMSDYKGVEKAAEVCMIWPSSAANQMGMIVEQCRLTDRILATDGRISGNAPLATRAGFVAEELHAESFNLDAILKNKTIRAFTDRYPNTPLSSNDPVNDIVITQDGKIVEGVQLKYYHDGQKTANAFREYGSDGKPHYQETDSMVCPSDQLEDVLSAAHKTEIKNRETRPQVSEAAIQVQEKVSDRLEFDGVESTPLSKREAEQVAKGSDEGVSAHRKVQNDAKNASTVQQTVKAAAGAAIVTTVIAGTLNTVSCLLKIQKGEMSSSDAMKYILKNTAIAASDSALKAAGATAAVSFSARTIPELFAGSALNTNLAIGAVGGAAICAIDLAEMLVMVAAGKMSWKDFEARTGKNIFQTGAGVSGASIGTIIGAAGGPVGAAVGAIIGGMITSMAATVAVENHVEKPFREIMENTKSIAETEMVMADAIDYLRNATVALEECNQWLQRSEQEFETVARGNRSRIASNWAKINAMK